MDSILTGYRTICACCGAPAEAQHHLIFGVGKRSHSEMDGLKIPVCNRCHNMGHITERIHDNPMAEIFSKKLGQLAWEKEYYRSLLGQYHDPAREAFRTKYGESYL